MVEESSVVLDEAVPLSASTFPRGGFDGLVEVLGDDHTQELPLGLLP